MRPSLLLVAVIWAGSLMAACEVAASRHVPAVATPAEADMLRRARKWVKSKFDDDAHQAFRAVDADQDGCISVVELTAALTQSKLQRDPIMAKWWAKQAMRKLDSDASACVDAQEAMDGFGLETAFTTEPRAMKTEL